MLRAMGADIQTGDRRVRVGRTERLAPIDIDVPRDVSAASFWLVAAGLIPGSRVRLPGVGLNPTRTGFVELLRRSGFTVVVSADPDAAGEPVGTIEAGAATELRPLEIDATTAAAMIDELPVLAVAATQLPGTSTVRGARELRVKESDRITAMAEALTAMGADITALEDGWLIRGPRHLEGATVDSRGDHRIAMAVAVAALMADGETEIAGAESVDISYPGFWDQLDALREGRDA
jgi:3-phosphoshikimate 1-carboxyvinyltransferase